LPPAGDLIGLVAETLEGLPIITAFGQNKYFIATAANKIDEHHRALFNGESLNLWLAFYCDLYGAILVLAVCIFAVLMRTQLGAAAVGLAFSNTIQVGKNSPALLGAAPDCGLRWFPGVFSGASFTSHAYPAQTSLLSAADLPVTVCCCSC
jgi:ABC-type multidrug transport system fused ATPase/permease subunit